MADAMYQEELAWIRDNQHVKGRRMSPGLQRVLFFKPPDWRLQLPFFSTLWTAVKEGRDDERLAQSTNPDSDFVSEIRLRKEPWGSIGIGRCLFPPLTGWASVRLVRFLRASGRILDFM